MIGKQRLDTDDDDLGKGSYQLGGTYDVVKWPSVESGFSTITPGQVEAIRDAEIGGAYRQQRFADPPEHELLPALSAALGAKVYLNVDRDILEFTFEYFEAEHEITFTKLMEIADILGTTEFTVNHKTESSHFDSGCFTSYFASINVNKGKIGGHKGWRESSETGGGDTR